MDETTSPENRTGGCDCGGVRYRIDGPVRQIIHCHCEPCRRITGNFMAATSAAVGDVSFEADARLSWFERTPETRYGFCTSCGSLLFWVATDKAYRLSITAGTLDDASGLQVELVLFGAELGDYSRSPEGCEVLPGDH